MPGHASTVCAAGIALPTVVATVTMWGGGTRRVLTADPRARGATQYVAEGIFGLRHGALRCRAGARPCLRGGRAVHGPFRGAIPVRALYRARVGRRAAWRVSGT